jgi:adenylosuccinate synthase
MFFRLKGSVMRRADIVVGLGFGDEGKGSWVDHLVRTHGAKTVVRFNGGAQAGHQVQTVDGREHIFAQFGSGTFVPRTETLLSRFMLVEPEALFKEASVLQQKGITSPLSLISISENAPVVTPFNRLLNRIAEQYRGNDRHGSCGFGIGVTQADIETLGERALYVRDLKRDGGLAKMRDLQSLKCEDAKRYHSNDTAALISELGKLDLDFYADLFLRFYHQVRVISEEECHEVIRDQDTVFEGAQGVLLDQCYGFFPHCTRSNCTFKNALTLLEEAEFAGVVSKVGLLRAYGTRHGAGPFVTEDSTLNVPPCHNHYNDWQGKFRVGWFDAVTARYALELVGSVNVLAISNLDRLYMQDRLKIAVAYEGNESEFFNRNSIHIIDCNYQRLTERTAALGTVTPVYENVDGFSSSEDRALIDYLETLETVLGCSINAYSTSSYQKCYR